MAEFNAKHVDGFCVVIAEDDLRLKRHSSDAAAEREAERLARENPGRRFFVLVTHGGVRAPPAVEWAKTVIDLPF